MKGRDQQTEYWYHEQEIAVEGMERTIPQEKPVIGEQSARNENGFDEKYQYAHDWLFVVHDRLFFAF
jgi:hypothetical protein